MLRAFWLLCLLCLFTVNSHARQSCDWPFRTSVQVQQSDFNGLSDYPIDLILTSSNMHSQYNWSSNGHDLRVYSDDDNTALSFTINSWDANAKLAEVRVSLPTLNIGTRTLYLYYGNPNVSSASQAVTGLPFVDGKIKFHTRSNQGVDPDNLAQAKNTFNQGNDTNTSYGCSHPDNFTAVTNQNQGTGRSNGNFIAYSKTKFIVDVAGNWGVRYGADFGLGGGLYINKVNTLEEIWNPSGDFWWNNNWNSPYVLDGSIYLTPGEHELEIIGAEGCCDGGVTVEFSRNYDGTNYDTANWLPFTSSNIEIRSEACPIPTLTVSYGTHDVCNKNIALSSSNNTTQYWTPGSTQSLSLSIQNQETNSTVTSGAIISFNVPNDLTLTNTSGSHWSCSNDSGDVTCIYNNNINASAQSATLVLTFLLDSNPSSSNFNFTPSVSGNSPDSDTSDNVLSFTINVLDDASNPASCTNPQPGLLASFFDTQGYSPSTINTETEYQNLVNTRGTMPYLFGQSIINQINGSGNPFDPDTNGDGNPDYFLGIFKGYIYLDSRTRLRFAVDGDDAIEARVNNAVVSDFYGAHAPNNSATNGSNRIWIDAGFTPVEFRIQEIAGGDAYTLYWSFGNNNQHVIIPSTAFFHCAGNPNIQLSSSVDVMNDPVNGTNRPKAIPGAVLQHTVTAENIGSISTDLNSTVLVQAIDNQSSLYVGNLSAGSPIIFNDGSGTQSTGLTYIFSGLANTTDSLDFSTNGSSFNYTPVPDADGYDANITHIRLTLDGTFKPTFNTITPTFNFIYQVKVD